MNRWIVLSAAVVLVSLLGYPLLTVAGGAPRFPSRSECIHDAVDGRAVDLVWGRYDDPVEADAFREHVVGVGFVGTEVLPDGCGRWKVVLEGVPSPEIAREVAAEAESVDLHPTLELDPDG